ncbi:hypothetical protein [Streptomyces sp. NPDC051567]|uniref:hypothetical protein n=1 Tax=Streptomyces sp. NPDC051567 TaxID=3365660 RepID=UPI0037B671BA
MPTPYGARGGMAFSAAELHVLRRSLAHALHPSPAPLPAARLQECLSLACSVDDAVQEADRLRTFLLADLTRYRTALPGSLSGYLALLRDALSAGYEPVPDDLAALRALRANPAAAALLDRAQGIAERSVRRRLTTAPAPRTRLLALAGGQEPRSAPRTAERAGERPGDRPQDRPADGSRPDRPIPTPGEVFPPRRNPAPPPAAGLVAG